MFGPIAKYLWFFSLLLCALQGFSCQRSEPPVRPEATLRLLQSGADLRLVAFGDPVTRGYAVQHPWPELLQE